MSDIHYDELKNELRIVGRLGKSCGEFMSVDGTWVTNPDVRDSSSLVFRIDTVNGIEVQDHLYYPSFCLNNVNPFGKDDPVRKVGSRWIIRCYETIGFYGEPVGFREETKIQGSKVLRFELTSQLNYVSVVEHF